MARNQESDYENLPRMPELKEAILPVVFLIIALSYSIIFLEVDPHIPIILSAAFTALIAAKIGIEWELIEEGIFKGIRTGLQAVIILMIVGMLIGSWIQSGIVPTMIYYGLQILSPQIFLTAAALMTAIVALFVGSSWSTAGTIGVALVGIGAGLGIPPGMVGGAIISGSFLGDKISPLSDTTNLAPGAAGDINVFDHIRHMLFVTLPAFVISLVLFTVIGFQFAGDTVDIGAIEQITTTLSESFWISPILMVVPLLIILMIIFKVPPIPALIGGAVIGGITAIIAQGAGVAEVLDTMHYGYAIDTGVETVDELLNAGGLNAMLYTVSLILSALSLGGILENCGFLAVLIENMLKKAKTYGQISLVSHITAIFVNMVTADQYLAIILPARMFRHAFKEVGAHPKNLSRAVESSATVTSSLIPWSSCGAFMYGVLGINPLVYAPFAFFNWITPLLSIAYGYLGIGFAEWTKEDQERELSKKAI